MTGRQGSTCPECGAPREADRTPSCDCTERAAEALRETRTAEAAAAEDFDPLRIRPYVDVVAPPAEEPPPAVPPAYPPPAAVVAPRSPGPPPDAPGTPRPRRRCRRSVLLAAGGLGAALAVAAVLALSSYHAPDRGRAAQEVRESIPDAPTRTPSSPPPPPAAPPAAPPRAPLSSAPATPGPDPSSPTASPSPSPTLSPTASPSPSSAPASGTPEPTPATAPVLRPGDTGPEVTELQQRLRQLNLYGDRIDGTYTRPVEDAVRNYQLARGVRGDTLGEYGPATRKSLESETTAP
ncbi:peptidoglycan-binding protein [Streptomyces sp. NPDC017248]|uniref:peptidoglycan-binding domain-containing protein n=1 Tax=unclassified Streptomyces TaxID=2593676 RepID=UPI0037AB41C8